MIQCTKPPLSDVKVYDAFESLQSQEKSLFSNPIAFSGLILDRLHMVY